ncbi:MAG TPA: LuxR C-terminal-related transcriptional regulator [Candidatus Acidoferrum sp.]|nr:LuxR C-terminal-related transcriptional regulator [Candidatus Acidoferrum sp.]
MDSRVEVTRAWDLFHLGAFAEVESFLSTIPKDAETERLRLWIANRRGDNESKRRLGAWLAEHGGDKLAAVGRAHENVALAALNLPRKEWLRATSKWAEAEVAFSRAVIAFIDGAPGEVRRHLASALPQIPEQRVRYAQLRAWIYGLVDDFERQATHLLSALSLALKENVDRVLIVRIAESLAPLVREVDLGELGVRAEELLEGVAWTSETATARFYTHRALAWRKALRGDWVPAMHLLDAALTIAPDATRRGLIFADRSRISLAAGEQISAASSCANALDCFSEINWVGLSREEATIVFGAMDVLRANREVALRLFSSAASEVVSKLIGMAHGRRLEGFKTFALSHLSDGAEALQHAQNAYKIFKELKYSHRATSCALRAVELGGGARWRERVERLVAAYPRSLAARQYERMTTPVARVRGRMREVAELLVSSNMTARQIGETLGMAEGTVRVHIKHMNKILNVENRSQLVRLFLESGSAA